MTSLGFVVIGVLGLMLGFGREREVIKRWTSGASRRDGADRGPLPPDGAGATQAQADSRGFPDPVVMSRRRA